MRKVKILGIPGSLRAASLNSALLDAAAMLAPAGVQFTVYKDIGRLPLFNPDLEAAEPAVVTELRGLVRSAGGLMIASPEYAHGVSGVIKNALDWLVSGEEFVYKPIALLNASQRATHAYAALAETLRTMNGRLIAEASLTVPLLGTTHDAAGIAADPQLSGILRTALAAFVAAIADSKGDSPAAMYGID